MCCHSAANSCSTKSLCIGLIVVNTIMIVLSLILFVVLKWKYLRLFTLIIMIVIFILPTLLLILSIIIYRWQKSGSIKTTTKIQAQKISSAGNPLTVILLIVCIIQDFAFCLDFDKANHPCGKVYFLGMYVRRNLLGKNSIDCNDYIDQNPNIKVIKNSDYAIAFCCLSLIELTLFAASILWQHSKLRIINGADGPLQPGAVAIQQQGINGAQYGFVQGNGQYVMQPNMYQGGYNSNQYQQQGQYQQVQQVRGDNGSMNPWNNTSGRNM